MPPATDPLERQKKSLVSRFREIGKDRALLAMLLLGFGAGIPYAVLTGTLNAWFTKAEVEVSTIGVLSWIGLAYAFKFLWSPTLHRSVPPITGRLGARRGWLLLFQAVIVVTMGTVSLLSPAANLGLITFAALLGVIASASQDIVVDAWRIEIADNGDRLDSLSVVYQFGYRTATFFGGFIALTLAARIGWNFTFALLTLTMLLAIAGVVIAREPERVGTRAETGVRLGTNLKPGVRHGALLAVLAGWAWALVMLGAFMVRTLTADSPPNVFVFIREVGPWIVAITVVAPAVLAAVLLKLDRIRAGAAVAREPSTGWRAAGDTLHRFTLEPLMDIVARLGWAAPLALILILSYRFTDLVWGSFAYPFYLGTNNGAMGYTLDEVAIASKLIGVIATIGGIAVGGLALKALGRMPCLIAGAVLAAVTNLLFWDLATGATYVGGFLELTRLFAAFELVGADQRLALLITAIAGENLAVGFASAVFVAYLSSIVNPTYAAVQYALLASLTMLVGTLGRGALGELIEERGFAYVFIVTALLGLVAVAASVAEAVRVRLFATDVDEARSFQA